MNHYFNLPMGETESPEEEVICHAASCGRAKGKEQGPSFPAWCPHDINSVYSSATVFSMTLGKTFWVLYSEGIHTHTEVHA